MSGAQLLEFSLKFMLNNGLTVSQYETMSNLSKGVQGTPDSMFHWLQSVKAMIGGQKYKRMKKEFDEFVKRDVGFLPIKIDESREIFENVLR